MLALRKKKKSDKPSKNTYTVHVISVVDLFNDLQQHSKRFKLVILDIRSKDDYLKCHIATSIHIDCSKLPHKLTPSEDALKDFKKLLSVCDINTISLK